MLRKISGKLRENLGIKILSVIIAIVIWYVVVGYNDPVITRSYTVKVSFTNQSYIQSGKQTYRSDDEYKQVLVYLKGNRSLLRDIDAEDITVTADLTQIVDMETTPVMVPLSVSCPGVETGNITLSRTAIPITIEEIASKEFPIMVDTGDSTPGKDYEVGVTTANPEKVVLNGPKSIVDSIDSVIARIDVTGMTQDGTRAAMLHLTDKNQEAIPASTVESELTFDGGNPEVSVYVDLWKKQSDVKLSISYSGEAAKGYQIGAISTTPETITVAGDENALAELASNGNTIAIPEEALSLDGLTADASIEVDLTEYLPKNMRTASSMSDTLIVNVTVLPEGSKELSIDVDKITISHLDANLTVSYDQTELIIRVKGIESDILGLGADDVKASIDLTGLGEGDYEQAVEITLPEGMEVVDKVTIPIHLRAAAETAADKEEEG